MTFQEQCIKFVFPKLIDSTNNTGNMAKEANVKVDALTSEVAQLQAKVQELEVQLADALDRVNMLEARIPEKKTRKPRAKKADPVQAVQEAAEAAQTVDTIKQALDELPF